MNCFHHSLPVTPKLRRHLRTIIRDRPAPGQPIGCQEILLTAARRLIQGSAEEPIIKSSSAAIRKVLNLLSKEEQVRQSLGEYYSLRLFAAEFQAARKEFRLHGDVSRLHRAARKLLKKIGQPPSDATNPSEPDRMPSDSARDGLRAAG